MVKKNRKLLAEMNLGSPPPVIDCACLIHDVLYDWRYVERLYNSLTRNLTPQVRLHVYTEKNRVVPPPMIHHPLEEWPGVRGPKKSWWYKIQLFNPRSHSGPLLYFDLDTVITGNIDWIWALPLDRFWGVKDFKYLFKPNKSVLNSSVMWFNPAQWAHVYQSFDVEEIVKKRSNYHGDQDFIAEKIPLPKQAFFDESKVQSWRWQAFDGGFDFRTRKHRKPGTGTVIGSETSILVFHGNPKPHEITDVAVTQHWS